MNLETRMKLERRIVRFLCRTMKAHGWTPYKVNDGEEQYLCRTTKDVMENVFAVDEASIIFKNEAGVKHSVFVVLGNDGYDCLCDYGFSEHDNFLQIMNDHVDVYTDRLAEEYS